MLTGAAKKSSPVPQIGRIGLAGKSTSNTKGSLGTARSNTTAGTGTSTTAVKSASPVVRPRTTPTSSGAVRSTSSGAARPTSSSGVGVRSTSASKTATATTASGIRSGNTTARSTATTARSTSATARSTSVQSNSHNANARSSSSMSAVASGQAPFHRPILAKNLSVSKVPVKRMEPVHSVVSSRTSKVALSASSHPATSTGVTTGGRSSSTSSLHNQNATRSISVNSTTQLNRSGSTTPKGGPSSSISARSSSGMARSPSPVTVKSKRCRHCSALVSDLKLHDSECPCAPTECKNTDSEHSSNVCGFMARGAKHLHEHQTTDCPFRLIPCQNSELGCSCSVSVGSMEKHIQNSCQFTLITCNHCKATNINRGMYNAHCDNECPSISVLCPLGCGREYFRSELTNHIKTEWSDIRHPRPQQQKQNNSTGEENKNTNNNNKTLPPESAQKVAETLLSCLEVMTQSREAEAILAYSDEVDIHPLAGDIESLEHSLFVGQSVIRSILRLEKYCDQPEGAWSKSVAQSVFELVERRAESAKGRLTKHVAESEAAAMLKSNLETTLGKVALKICE